MIRSAFNPVDRCLAGSCGSPRKNVQYTDSVAIDFLAQAICYGLEGVLGSRELADLGSGLQAHAGVYEHDLAMRGSKEREQGPS